MESNRHDGAVAAELRASDRMITLDDLPVARAEIELSAPPVELDLVNAGPQTRKIFALVRLHTHPLGIVVLDAADGRAWQTHAQTVCSAMRKQIDAHLAADGLPCTDGMDLPFDSAQPTPRCVTRREAVLADAPEITVIIGTRERAANLRQCLDALLHMEYPRFEIVVVDNDPVTSDTAELVANHYSSNVRYVREDRRGLSSAHNRGLEEATTEIVAFVDDDVIVDKHWLTGIAEGFAADADVGCVTGLILPAELDTPAQLLLQRHGGYDKGFELRIFDTKHNRPDDPLFPFTVGRLGSGANMAFDTEILRRLGGFDRAMGIGTFARGGDDLMAFFRVVLRHRLVYQPAAAVWHRHHRDMAALPYQAECYGVGYGAFLASALLHEPAAWATLLRRVPAGFAYAFSPSSARNRFRYEGLPTDMARREKLGLLTGPPAYVISRWRARRAVSR